MATISKGLEWKPYQQFGMKPSRWDPFPGWHSHSSGRCQREPSHDPESGSVARLRHKAPWEAWEAGLVLFTRSAPSTSSSAHPMLCTTPRSASGRPPPELGLLWRNGLFCRAGSQVA